MIPNVRKSALLTIALFNTFNFSICSISFQCVKGITTEKEKCKRFIMLPMHSVLFARQSFSFIENKLKKNFRKNFEKFQMFEMEENQSHRMFSSTLICRFFCLLVFGVHNLFTFYFISDAETLGNFISSTSYINDIVFTNFLFAFLNAFLSVVNFLSLINWIMEQWC